MSARRARRPLRFPLRLQALEGRIAPATFTVSNINDSGSGSLRQAVTNANGASGADLINFSSYFNVPRTITLASQISITGAVTIDGTSAANVTISGNDVVRIFNTQAAAAGTPVSLVDLTLKSGYFANEPGGAVRVGNEALSCTRCIFTDNENQVRGGAISLDAGGSLTATDCVFTANFGVDGGAISLDGGGPLTLTNCDFTSNIAPYSGGAISVVGGGSLTATNCAFTSNTAQNYGGGAIAMAGAGANAILSRCQISGNVAGAGGGGLSIFGNLILEASTVSGNQAVGLNHGGYYYPGAGGGIYASGSTTVQNSTISSNRAGSGGGIENGGTVVVQNSTITGNAATYWLGGGGGISRGTISLESSIVAYNSGFYGPDISASTVNAKNSSIFNRFGITVFNNLGGNRPEGENPRLGPLQDNGGPTMTQLLLPGSPCVNAGSNPANLSTDQRGPGFPRVLAGTADMGAAEGVDVNPTVVPVSIPPTITVPSGTTYTVIVRYDDDIGIDPATIDLSDILVSGPGYAVPQTPTAFSIAGSGALVTVTYTLPAPGGAFDFTDDGLYSVAMIANQVGDSDVPVHHFVAAGSLGAFRVAIPGTYAVDEPSDVDDGNTTQGHLSLREAIRLTNAALFTADTITFDPAVFGSPRTIAVTAGVYNVFDPLVLIGPGSDLLTLDGGGTSRLFFTNPQQATGQVSLSGLTLTNGAGGAILAIGALTLSGVVISNSRWLSSGGGGVGVIGSLTMLDCIVRNNTAGSEGGGIYVSGGPVVIQRSSVVNNRAGTDGGGLIIYAQGTVQISDSTFSGNQSSTQYSGSGGGAIRMSGTVAAGSFIRNSTISGNFAANGSFGGGLSLYFDGTLPIANSTITGNSTTGRGGGIAVTGSYYFIPNVSLSSTIITGNSAGSGPDLYFDATSPIGVSGDNNLVGVANAGNFTLSGTGNQTGTLAVPLNAMLGLLANNGGPTKTHALLPGSPALNAGNSALGLAYDQRGTGFARVVGGAADIGAFEAQAVPPTAVVQVDDGAAQRSAVRGITVTFSGPVGFTGGNANAAAAFQLVRTGPTGPTGTVTLAAAVSTNGLGQTVVVLTFSGSFIEWNTAAGANKSLIDGLYTLRVFGSAVAGAGGVNLDGDVNGTAGGDKVVNTHRLFGDVNGDKNVDLLDLGALRTTFNVSAGNPAFLDYLDADHNGTVDLVDLSEFRSRFNTGF